MSTELKTFNLPHLFHTHKSAIALTDVFTQNLFTILASYLNFDECMLLSKVNKQFHK